MKPGETGTAHCSAHGPYTTLGLPGADATGCPECYQARRRQEEERDVRERVQAQREARALGPGAGLPSRYHPATLAMLLEATEEQRQLKRLVEWVIHHAADPDSLAPGAILVGTPGTGKTLAGACMVAGAIRAGVAARYTTMLAMIRSIRDTWGKRGTESRVFHELAGLELLVLDEVGVQFGSETEAVYFTELLNARYANKRVTVIITNLAPAQLRELSGARVWDRLQHGGRKLILTGESLRK